MTIELNVIDAGARYGLHPSWQPVRNLARLFLFEVDADEAGRLARKYAKDQNITVYPHALFSRETTLKFHVRAHHALNSIYEVNEELLAREHYMHSEHNNVGAHEVKAVTIDGFFADTPIHFLKLDTEGAELEILTGAEKALGSTILGVRAEVPFAPILKDAPLFGDIHKFMLDRGFELLNLDYTGRGSPRSPFTNPDRFGKLMSSDAVWIITPERLFDSRRPNKLHDIVRMATFLMLNSATDVAMEVLLRGAREEGLRLAEMAADPVARNLQRSVALLLKNISYQPAMSAETIDEAYRTLFGTEFPSMHRFFESDLFE